MAATTEAKIMEALFARVASLVFSPVLPVAWPNVSFTPPANQRYLRVQFVPNTANRTAIGSNAPHQHLGLLQVSVCWSKGVGEAAAREIAGAVAAHFPCDLKLSSGSGRVRITKRPDVKSNAEMNAETRDRLKAQRLAERTGAGFIGPPNPWAHRKRGRWL